MGRLWWSGRAWRSRLLSGEAGTHGFVCMPQPAIGKHLIMMELPCGGQSKHVTDLYRHRYPQGLNALLKENIP